MKFPSTNGIYPTLSIFLCLISQPSFALEVFADVTEITFAWGKSSGPVSGYSIELTKNYVVTQLYATTAANESKLTIAELNPGDRFSIRVRAFDDQFRFGPYSSPSEEVRILEPNFWFVGSFPTCSSSCEGLQVTREVYCLTTDRIQVGGNSCLKNEPRPIETGTCTTSPCTNEDVVVDKYPTNLQVLETFLFSVLKDASPSYPTLNNSDILREGNLVASPDPLFPASSFGLSGGSADELNSLSFSGPVSSRIYFSVDRESVGTDFAFQYEDVYDEQIAGQVAGDIYASVQDGQNFHILNQDQIGLAPSLGVRQETAEDVDELDALDAHELITMPDTLSSVRYTIVSSNQDLSGATIFGDGMIQEHAPSELGLMQTDVIDGLHIDYSLGDIYFSLARNSASLSQTAYLEGEPLDRLYSPADILVTRAANLGGFTLAIRAESLGLVPEQDNVDAFTFALIQAPLGSLDSASPSVEDGGLNESSIYGPPLGIDESPQEKYSAFNLGLQGFDYDDIDAFTRQEPSISSGQLVNFYFYVNTGTEGKDDTAVREQSELGQQASDIFSTDFSEDNELVSNQDNQAFLPSEAEFYSNIGSQDNADALDIAGTRDPIFSLKKGNAFGVSGATLLKSIGNGDFEEYRTPQDLGLSDEDDVDALHIDPESGVIFFSLAPGSPYLDTYRYYGPADIFSSYGQGENFNVIRNYWFGLNNDDDVTGICFSKSNPTRYAPEVPGTIQIGVGVLAATVWCIVTGFAGCT
ncbi:MAG: hypothetical protein O6942_03740 [Bacteroidetes bacterium]|nr:hypothetical protein [Bacteroidota bacterium]